MADIKEILPIDWDEEDKKSLDEITEFANNQIDGKVNFDPHAQAAKSFNTGLSILGETVFDTGADIIDWLATPNYDQEITNSIMDHFGTPELKDQMNKALGESFTGDASYQSVTGIDNKKLVEDTNKYYTNTGQGNDVEYVLQRLPSDMVSAAATYYTMGASALEYKAMPFLQKLWNGVATGAVDFTIGSALHQELMKDPEFDDNVEVNILAQQTGLDKDINRRGSLANVDPKKAAVHAGIGAAFGGTIVLGVEGTPIIKEFTKDVMDNQVKPLVQETRLKLEAREAERRVEKETSKVDRVLDAIPALRRDQQETIAKKRIGRTVVRIIAKTGIRELEHLKSMYFELGKDISEEIGYEVVDATKTFLKSRKKSYADLTEVEQQEIAQTAFDKMKEKLKSLDPRKFKPEFDTTKINQIFDNSDMAETSSATRMDLFDNLIKVKNNILNKVDTEGVKVFTDDLFSKYQMLASDTTQKVVESLNRKLEAGTTTLDDIRGAVSDIFDDLYTKTRKPSDIKFKEHKSLAEQDIKGAQDYLDSATESGGFNKPKLKQEPEVSKMDLEQMKQDATFFARPIEEIAAEYKAMPEAGKVDFIQRFKELSDVQFPKTEVDALNKSLEKIDTLGSEIAKLQEDNIKITSQIAKEKNRTPYQDEKVKLSQEDPTAGFPTKRQPFNAAQLNKTKLANTQQIKKLEAEILKEKAISTELKNKVFTQEDDFMKSVFGNRKMFEFYKDEIVAGRTNKFAEATGGEDIFGRNIESKAASKKNKSTIVQDETKDIFNDKKIIHNNENYRVREMKYSDAIDANANTFEGEMYRTYLQGNIDDVKLFSYDSYKPGTKYRASNSSLDEANGLYQLGRDTDGTLVHRISFDAANKTKAEIQPTLVHEGFHALANDIFERFPELAKEFQGIISDIGDQIGMRSGLRDYGPNWYLKPDELIAEFFSKAHINEKFKDLGITSNEKRTILKRIGDFLKRIFGINYAKRNLGITSKYDSTVGERLNQFMDDIAAGKYEYKGEPRINKEHQSLKSDIDYIVSSSIDNALSKIGKTLKDTGIFEMTKDGTIKIGSFETPALKEILTDIGLANKKTFQAIKDFRSNMLGSEKIIETVAKTIIKVIDDVGVDNESLKLIIQGDVASRLKNKTATEILSMDINEIATKHNISIAKLKQIVENFGQIGVGKPNHYANEKILFQENPNKVFVNDVLDLVTQRSLKDMSPEMIAVAENNQFKNMMNSITELENELLGSKKQTGYTGFASMYNYETKIGILPSERANLKAEGWKEVGDTGTFYRLELEGNISNGILPSKNQKYQGRVVKEDSKNFGEYLKAAKSGNMKWEIDKRTGDLRIFPDDALQDTIMRSSDTKKLLARKAKTLMEEKIRQDIAKNLTNEVKRHFSYSSKPGYVKLDPENAMMYAKALGYGKNSDVYVNKTFHDTLVGVKESLLYNGDNRLVKLAETTYKDMFKRFKKTVTVQSVSSIVNNYLVIPSTLFMHNIPVGKIIPAMRDAHISYANFMTDFEKVAGKMMQDGNIGSSVIDIKKFIKDNNMQLSNDFHEIFELFEKGKLQSGIDDQLLQLSNAGDMFTYGLDKFMHAKGYTGGRADTILKNILMNPDSAVGSYFMNKFVMADIVGRVSLYKSLKRMGMSRAEAMQKSADAFVDYSAPLPKPIRMLEEYGVPFIGWAYRMQMPIMRMIKENPTNAAAIIGTYYLLDGLSGSNDGYVGGVKTDTWFLHNSALDTNVFSMAPIAKGELPNLKPQMLNEIDGVVRGNKSILELTGLNVR